MASLARQPLVARLLTACRFKAVKFTMKHKFIYKIKYIYANVYETDKFE